MPELLREIRRDLDQLGLPDEHSFKRRFDETKLMFDVDSLADYQLALQLQRTAYEVRSELSDFSNLKTAFAKTFASLAQVDKPALAIPISSCHHAEPYIYYSAYGTGTSQPNVMSHGKPIIVHEAEEPVGLIKNYGVPTLYAIKHSKNNQLHAGGLYATKYTVSPAAIDNDEQAAKIELANLGPTTYLRATTGMLSSEERDALLAQENFTQQDSKISLKLNNLEIAEKMRQLLPLAVPTYIDHNKNMLFVNHYDGAQTAKLQARF